MGQSLIKVPPTKNTLLNLKKQVRFLEDGHTLLERKRELLTRLVYQRINEYRTRREQAHRAIRESYHWLSIACLRMGSRALHQTGLGIDPSIKINIIYSTMFIFYFIKFGIKNFIESEMALGRLIAEQRKAQKRVNALKYNIIPKYKNTIRYIESMLEEEERNVLFQIKLLRERKAG